MKDFIKTHPYLSCVGFNFIISIVWGGFLFIPDVIRTGFSGRLVIETISGILILFICTLICTLPAICILVIDRYANQKLFDNKPLQYGLTAIESLLFYPSIFFRGIDVYKEFFKDLFFEPDRDWYTHEVMLLRIITALLLIQSLGFKYIFDSANKKNKKLEFED